MATQTVPDSAPAPPAFPPCNVSLQPISASLGRFEWPKPEGRDAITSALDLLQVWIAACGVAGKLCDAGDGDIEALSWMMITIGDLLKRLESGGQDLPTGFFMAKSTLHAIELYLSDVFQGSKPTELPSAAMAGSAAYAYRLLAGLYGPTKAAS